MICGRFCPKTAIFKWQKFWHDNFKHSQTLYYAFIRLLLMLKWQVMAKTFDFECFCCCIYHKFRTGIIKNWCLKWQTRTQNSQFRTKFRLWMTISRDWKGLQEWFTSHFMWNLIGLIWYLIDTIPSTKTFLKNEKCYPYPLILPSLKKVTVVIKTNDFQKW